MPVTTRFIPPALIAMLLTGVATAAPGPAQWQAITASAGSNIELDQQRIRRLADGKTSAWTRLTLDHPVLDFENQFRYTAVEALNHYDCTARSFVTRERVYRLDGRTMKAEKVREPRRIDTVDDSMDARLLDEVCKPRTVGEMQRIAVRAAEQAAAQPRAMHAEMVVGPSGAAQPRSMKVADAHAPKPAAAAPAAPPAAATAEKPRFIEMPLIDKSKVEDPYKGAGATPVAAPAAPAPAPVPVAHPAASPIPAARVVDSAPAHELSRKERELQLATSGPRRSVAKKKAVEAAPSFEHVHWGYAGLGAPENWAKIQPGYATCATGTRQSPIDIRNGIKVDLEQVRFDYRNTPFRIVDNGHTVQVNVGEGSTLGVMGRTYQLVQFHFHRPSEERINGKPFDMVVHLVHKDYDNNLAVVAVMIEKGGEHPAIQTLWNHMPLEVGQEMAPPNVSINLSTFLPISRDYYTYMGSLTTPPCTENVLWMVFKTPIQLAPEQIGIFARLYPNNARPVQSTSDRLIKESR